MATHSGDLIKTRREASNMAMASCAKRAGISVHEWGDIEQHADALVNEVSMGEARRVCDAVGLDLVQLAGFAAGGNAAHPVRHEVVLKARERLRMTQAELSDQIGFEEYVIRWLERSSDFFEALPVKVIVDLANALSLDPSTLIRIR
jgi:transcriptional regulator with XRE-family HTH domain